ncbi:MAG: hypothetical protein K2I21_15915 [Acetatifactor sp.]|nr:hypothetical protein [Acetatifactor sp.]
MMILIIFGIIIIGSSFFILYADIGILIKGKRAVGEICGIEFHGNYGGKGIPYFIEVQFKEKGQDIKLVTAHSIEFVPFFVKLKLSRRRRKLIGKRVHIYYIPGKRRVLLREYLWEEFLMAAFLFFLGLIVILSIVYKWY